MKTVKLTLQPKSPFGTPVAGDTLFGHLCWAICERNGKRALTELLEGYSHQRPFLAISDGFPSGRLPRPTAPDHFLGIAIDPSQRKSARTHRWVSGDQARLPISEWTFVEARISERLVLTQNTVNRLTGTTRLGEFAPRQVERTFFDESARLDIYAALDDTRLPSETLQELFEDIGQHGYGRDATTGLGKFAVIGVADHAWPRETGQWWLTLAPCAPDPNALDADHCFYLPVTRFGRHGNLVVTRGAPFKSPLLMAAWLRPARC